MKRDLVVAGKALAGTGLTGVILYLVATAPTHVHVYWPYWVFVGMILGGLGLYYAGEKRAQPAKQNAAPPSDEAPELLSGAAVTDRWRSSLDGVSSEMLQLQNNSMSHHGYMRRSSTDNPPSVRIGIRVTSAQLDPAAVTSELRAAFLRFLERSAVMDLVRELTAVPSNARWIPRDENPPFNFGAVLALPGTEEAPVAWARVLLPDSITRQYGRDARSAYLVLYVEPRIATGAPAPAASLALWDQHLGGVLKLPAAFAAFLADELALPTADDPPAEVGVWLKAPRALTELVEIDGFDVVDGSPQSNWFMGFAIASPNGEPLSGMVLAWLRQLCDSSLHLLDYESDLASLGSSATGPRLAVRVLRNAWDAWYGLAYVAALEVELSNATDRPIRIGAVGLTSDWLGQQGDFPKLGYYQAPLELYVDRISRSQYEPALASLRSVPPRGSVSGWVVTTTALREQGGTPQLELSVREAIGTTHLTVIPPTDQQVSSGGDRDQAPH